MADSSDAVLAAVWSILDFFADGVSFVFMVGGLLLMSGVDMRAVRAAARFSWAFRWRLRADLSENFFSQRVYSNGFSPV